MHKSIIKFFNFLRSSLDFARILVLLILILFLFYWIKILAGIEMSFLNFALPVLEGIVNSGEKIFSGSANLFSAVFEYKYAGGLVIIGIFYALTHVCNFLVDKIEDGYNTGRGVVKKIEENAMNATLQKELKIEQYRYKNYKVYVSLSVKQKFRTQIVDVDIDEQNKILNKFLIEKLGVSPVKLGKGFVYSFGNFETLDNTLEVFFKVLNSTAPVNYIVCVQAFGINQEKENSHLDSMIALSIQNKIITLPETIFRYRANTYNKYETTCLGEFKANDVSFEVHEFMKN